MLKYRMEVFKRKVFEMKKRYTVRVLCVLLCAFLCLSLFACSASEGEEIPEGMQLATAAGARYRFYIPTHWSVSVDYGISGGYYSLGKQSTVSMRDYPITEEMTAQMPTADAKNAKARADWFYENSLLPLIHTLSTGGSEAVEINYAAVLLDGVNARQYHQKATVGEETLNFVHVVGEKGGSFYVLSLTVAEELYAGLVEDFVKISDAFAFSDTPYVPSAPQKELPADENTPDGMQAASNSDVAYGFYVPTSWRVDTNQSIFAAIAPDGTSSVSVVPYLPSSNEIMSIREYFELNRAMMKKTAPGGYEDVSEKEVTLDGVSAMQYEYRYTVGGVMLSYMQIITVWRGMFYNLTYTARPENYEGNLADVARIVNAFDFR